MMFSSNTKKPQIHASAYVAPTAIISGEVTIGAGCAILHGAVISAEGAPLVIGGECVVMEHAVIKSSGGTATRFPTTIGDNCIVGPHAFVVGATIGKGCFIASGARVSNGVTLEKNTRLAPNEARQPKGDFFETVFNLEESPDVAAKAAHTYAKFLRKTHAQDATIADTSKPAGRRNMPTEEPPQAVPEVEGVVDAMMLELQEMEHIRQEALKKKKR